MPYSKLSELPSNIRDPLPTDAQRVWMRVFNESYARCQKNGGEDCETVGRTSAWMAVKNGWKKGKEGKWVRK